MDKGSETASCVPIDAPVSMRPRVGTMFFIVLVLSLKVDEALKPSFPGKKAILSWEMSCIEERRGIFFWPFNHSPGLGTEMIMQHR